MNKQANRQGISECRRKEVKAALRNFSKTEAIPAQIDRSPFKAWVNRNVKLYIGRSDATEENARMELGKWLVTFLILFPDEKIPPNPCK